MMFGNGSEMASTHLSEASKKTRDAAVVQQKHLSPTLPHLVVTETL